MKRDSEKDVDADKDDDMLPEYDFTGAVQGKYYKRYREGTNVVLIEPDLHKLFPTAESVNAALRRVAKGMRTRPRVRTESGKLRAR